MIPMCTECGGAIEVELVERSQEVCGGCQIAIIRRETNDEHIPSLSEIISLIDEGEEVEEVLEDADT